MKRYVRTYWIVLASIIGIIVAFAIMIPKLSKVVADQEVFFAAHEAEISAKLEMLRGANIHGSIVVLANPNRYGRVGVVSDDGKPINILVMQQFVVDNCRTNGSCFNVLLAKDFWSTVLEISRIVKKGEPEYEDLLKEFLNNQMELFLLKSKSKE